MHSLRRRSSSLIATLAIAAAAAGAAGMAPPAAADSTPGLKDPWTSSCNSDKTAIDSQPLTKDPEGNGVDDAGTVILFYSPSCQTNWIELTTPYGTDQYENRINLFIGTTESPWTNDRSQYDYGDGPLTSEFRSMMIPAPGHTCVHYYGNVETFQAPEMVNIGMTPTDKTVC